MHSEPTATSTNNVTSRDTAGNEIAFSLHTKMDTATTEAAKLTKAKPFHPTEELRALRMDQANLTRTATKDPAMMTKVEKRQLPSNQVRTKQIAYERLRTHKLNTATGNSKLFQAGTGDPRITLPHRVATPPQTTGTTPSQDASRTPQRCHDRKNTKEFYQ